MNFALELAGNQNSSANSSEHGKDSGKETNFQTKGSEMLIIEQDHQNSLECLELKNPSMANDKQNLVSRSDLKDSLFESKIKESEDVFVIDNSGLDHEFLVEAAGNQNSSANSSEHGKDSEKETPGKNSEGSSIFNTTENSSSNSQRKGNVPKDLLANDHEHNKTTAALPMDGSLRENYRCDSDSWSDDDDDSSSDSSSDTSSSDSDFCRIMVESSAPKRIPNVKTKGELGLEDLPPIEDLVISVEKEEMTLIGKIHAVVDKLVVIHAIQDMKPLDLDSVLFLSHDKPLGRVFDVFGPVVEPFYCVRFNNVDDISDKQVVIGSDVFFAPQKPDFTTYVFVDELQRQKGSDASWKDNNEPPEEFLDFSDDEKEKAAKRKRAARNRNRQFSNSIDVAPKRPFIAGSPSQYNGRNFARSTSPRNNIQTFQFTRHNPFSAPPIPPPSPSPSICSVMSMPVRVQNSFNPLSTPNQQCSPFSDLRRPYLQQNLLHRSPKTVLYGTYQQPQVFGQMAPLLSPMPSPLPSPSPFNPPALNNIPTLIPAPTLSPMAPQNYFNQRFPNSPAPLSPIAPQSYFNQRFPNSPAALSPMAPQSYFNQRFSRNPSPMSQSQHTLPDPWISNRPPDFFHVPPNHPLTVQIPNQNNPPVSLPPTFQQNAFPLQPFVNNNINFSHGNVQSRFY